MSRLSVHYNDSGNKNGFGDFLKKCHDAGSPVGVIYSLNGNIAPTIAQNSPGTQWVYRLIFECVRGEVECMEKCPFSTLSQYFTLLNIFFLVDSLIFLPEPEGVSNWHTAPSLVASILIALASFT